MQKFLLLFVALLLNVPALAAVQTITRTGTVVAQIGYHPFWNPGGTTSIEGISLGDAVSFSATYDDADFYDPNPRTTIFGEVVSGPKFRAVGLGNGNPVNAVSASVGTYSFSLTDQICFMQACAADLEFPTGPTLLFNGDYYLGMDSCLFDGGGTFGTAVSICQLTLDNLAPFLKKQNISVLGYSRSDIWSISAINFDAVYFAHFDGPGVANLPEPTGWALLTIGLGLIVGPLRRWRPKVVA